MKIYSTDLKSVKQLTKYISLEKIEKLRYKRYNAPKIKESNLLCDQFFRTEELFDRKNDIIRSYQPYSVDDLPVYDRTSLNALYRSRFEGPNTNYIESDVPYYVDIIGENKRIYIEEYGTKSPKYQYEAKADLSLRPFWRHNKNSYKDLSIDEIVNVTYYAQKLTTNNSHEVKHIALGMLNDGFPLEAVINIMKDAKLKDTVGDVPIPTPFMRFLSEYPNLRRYMITYSKNKSEVFDLNGAKVFSGLVDMCNGDTKEAYKILWDCRLMNENESYSTSLDFVELAKFMYRKDNTWNEEKANILDYIKNRISLVQPSLIKRTYKYITQGVPLNKIPEQLTPYHMRGRLVK